MNRRTLVLVSTIAGFVLLAALVLFPMMTMTMGDETDSRRAIEGGNGPWLLLFGWVAAGFSALVLMNKADYIGVPEAKSRMLSFLGYKLFAFFAIAILIAGTPHEKASWGAGFWIAFLASIVGAAATYLTFNEALARKIADKAKEMKEGSGDEGGSGDAGSKDTPSNGNPS